MTNVITISFILLAGVALLAAHPGGGDLRLAEERGLPADPPVAETIGFFLDDWKPRAFVEPAAEEGVVPSSTTDTVTVYPNRIITKIPAAEFGHNANTWMTDMVSQPLFMDHVAHLRPHIIRFPAGSGSDVYFWNHAPGDLPSDVPALLTNNKGEKKTPGFFFGKLTGRNSASLDDYYSMLEKTGNEGLLTVNYGYARYGTSADPVATAAHLAADWVRYDNGRTRYWEVGNECFGDWEWGYRIDPAQNKDGQPELLTGQLYARHFKVFADSMKNAARAIGKEIYIGAVTSEAEPLVWQTNTLKTWNSGMMRELQGKADFYVVHNYFTPYDKKSMAADILRCADTTPGRMMRYLKKALRENGAVIKPIAMDEWNMFATGAGQQVSNVSGVFAVIVIGESLTNKFGLAARWDMLNGWDNGNDHGLFSSGNEPGVKMWSPRPSFYYMYYLQKMMGDRLVDVRVGADSSIKAYGSLFSSGETGVILANTDVRAKAVTIKPDHWPAGHRFYWYALDGGEDNEEFSRKVRVNGHGTSAIAGGPSDYATLKAESASTDKGIKVLLPARGAVFVVIGK